ncbi:hypothetical protein BELL_0270g00020 [Botrytis elliptica]|uniref:Uncharacterized protein n=1 Tax=Botrytis elliptica TaxID=278938 RepID=A0A4Z1JLZ4_9HELO|nr:hypothetical protein BELL_0270g00020 [Botrytis elliptica]
MPPNPIQKSKVANKPAPNDKAVKQSWLRSKLRFLQPERYQRKSSTPQVKHIEAWQYKVASDFIPEPRKKPSQTENSYKPQRKHIEAWQREVDAHFIPKPRKKSSRTKRSQTSRLPEKEPDGFTFIGNGGYFESPQADLTRIREPPPIRLSQELRQSYSETKDSQDPPNIFRTQTTNIPLQANPPKPHSRAKPSSSQNNFRSGPPRAPSTISFEAHMEEFPEFDHFRPIKEYQKLQRIIEETKHARPQTVIASEVQRHKSVAGAICHEPSRRSSMPFSEASHSRPGSSRIHAPVGQFQALILEAQDRRDADEKHQRLLARSRRPRIPVTPNPLENISQSGTRYLRRVPITRSSHQPAAIPIHSSARPYRPRAPNTPRPSENNVRLETGFLERFPTSHQPSSSSRPHRPPTTLTPKPPTTLTPNPPTSLTPKPPTTLTPKPPTPLTPKLPTPLTPKPPQRTVHFQEKPSPGVPNTLKKRRPPPKSPQPLSDEVKPRPPLRPCLISKVSSSICYKI